MNVEFVDNSDVVLEELRQEELKKKEEAPSASAADSASATD